MKLRNILIVLLLLLLVINTEAIAQCAMCKAAATSNIEGETNNVGKGLNTGILYLMAIPYLILGTLFFFFFKKQIIEKFKSYKNIP